MGSAGEVEIIDPDPEMLPLIEALSPGFRIASGPLPGFVRPRLLITRERGAGVGAGELAELTTARLWELQARAADGVTPLAPGEASVLVVKLTLARRSLSRCTLCAHRCGIDRLRGELGRCGLGPGASIYEAYVHIAEEPPINPAFNIALRGCGLRCRSCQQFRALKPNGPESHALTPAVWQRLDLSSARSLVFIGGNPTESLPAILDFLRGAPDDFALPVGWNTHGYDTVEAIRLLDGVVDVYVPDFKYGSDACAERLSGAPGYVVNAESIVREMCRQGVPVLVRILVLPGHNSCCHLRTLERLEPLRQQVHLNILGQYAPDFLIGPGDGPLTRRPLRDEVTAVRDAAQAAGFVFV